MRVYQRILLVAVLTLAMIAAGVAWERFYVSPLIEQAQQKPDLSDSATDELPAECLEELATMGQPSAAIDRTAERELALKAAASHGSPIEDSNVFRPGGSSNQAAHVEAADSSPLASPVHQAQSAEWIEPMALPTADPRHERRSPPNVLPASAQGSPSPNTLSSNGNSDALKSVDVLDLMRRLRGDDEGQRAEARRELARRGFSEVDLELARQLFSPDVETRKQLARAVPRLSSVDAAQWLMWLALDPQPEVRLAAISTLATTGDPAVLDRAERWPGVTTIHRFRHWRTRLPSSATWPPPAAKRRSPAVVCTDIGNLGNPCWD